MELLFIENLPFRIGKGAVYGWLLDEGRLRKEEIGRIRINHATATVEIDQDDLSTLVRRLDGLTIESRRIHVWRQAKRGEQPHFDNLLRWLDLEADAEKEQLQNRIEDAHNLSSLVIREESIGLGGRIVLRLGLRNEQARLPWTRLNVGSPVIMTGENGAWRGVVARRSSLAIDVAFSQSPEVDGTVRLDLAQDEISRRRMAQAIGRVAAAKGNRLAQLRDILLGLESPQFTRDGAHSAIKGISSLNRVQQEAVALALSADDVALIHGPPGTGKTSTLVELIIAAVARGERVLACAPSNLAVDNLVERLAATTLNIVRVGDPIRVLPAVQDRTLDALVEQHADYRVAKKLRREAQALQRDADRWKRARPAKGEKAAKRAEAGDMFAEARELEQSAVERVLNAAQVTLATLTGIDSTTFGQRQYDLCVIDEAGQSTEAATWIPIVRSKKVVLAGDHQQLPPTILSQQARDEGFGRSLLEQLMDRDGERIARQLIVQYRMHDEIMAFSSGEFYSGTLESADSVKSHLLADLPNVQPTPLTTSPLTFIDTAGASYDEEQTESFSRRNPQEAELVLQQVSQLLEAGVLASQIALITPYSAQVDLLRERLAGGENGSTDARLRENDQLEVEVGSVDGMQGREQEAVVISLVRSNYEGEIGFLSEVRRMNVAFTRARRKLIVVGDSATVTADPFFARFVAYCEAIGAYQSVWEL